VIFRQHRHNYKEYAQELLAEIPQAIKEYMEERDILPNNELVKKHLKAQNED
jgi:hypothetical protein